MKISKSRSKTGGGLWKRYILLVSIFLTSFTSLVYEIIWSRKLSLLFGASTLAVSTVLSVFMAGLALGTLYGGKLIEKAKNPYRFLSIIEVFIGFACLSSLLLIENLNNAYLILFNLVGENLFWVNILNFILSAIVLIMPTFLIGVVFPVIVKLYYKEINQVGGSVSWCYSVDTIGGALGALVSGLFIIWSLGLWKTSLLASTVNITLGIVLYVLFNDDAIRPDNKTKQRKDQNPITDNLVLGLFFFSGFAALVLENVWIRFFDMIYGNSLISFSMVIAVFLFGLGFGSFLAKFVTRSIKDKILLFSALELLIGVSGLILLLIFPSMETQYLKIFYEANSYGSFLSQLGILAVAVLLIPTTLMGMTLPVLSTIYTRGESIAPDIGRLFASNSFGAILGSFLSGFVLFYWIGLNNTAILASIIYIGVGIVFMYRFKREQFKVFLAILSSSLTIIVLLFELFYQPNYLYNGAYYHGTVYEDHSGYFIDKEEVEILFSKQSPYSFVSVVSDQGILQIKINGRSEATSKAITQNMLANLPLLFHQAPDNVAIIGHGGGYTLNSVTQYPMVQSIDAIEIDQVIIEANQYIEDNGEASSDPRVNLIIADGRNYLFTSPHKYDVIISQPSHIWASSSLFTQEFFEIAKSKLNDGGIFTIWLPRFEMSDFDYAIMVNTLNSVFPHYVQFDFRRNMIFLASNHQIVVPDDLVISHTEALEVKSELYLAKILAGEKSLELHEFIQSHYYPEVEEYLDSHARGITLVNTDDLPILEFTTLRNTNYKFLQETR
jgi:spermidine synthase